MAHRVYKAIVTAVRSGTLKVEPPDLGPWGRVCNFWVIRACFLASDRSLKAAIFTSDSKYHLSRDK